MATTHIARTHPRTARPGRPQACSCGPAAATPAPPATERAHEPLIQVRLLGPVQVWRAGQPLPPGPPQQQLILALLALQPGTMTSRDDLIDTLWQHPPASAVGMIHKHISNLRSQLDPARVQHAPHPLATVAGGYELRLNPAAIDTSRFAHHHRQARQAHAHGDLTTALHHLTHALALGQGTPLAGLPGPRAQSLRQHLTATNLAAAEQRADILLALGGHTELAGELASLASSHPLREGLWHRLMLAHYQCGHPAAALAAYHDLRHALADQLGTDPTPQLTHLYQQILRHDPHLDPTRPATDPPSC